MTRDEAITMLVKLFNDNKLTFHNIALLGLVFDEAIVACDEGRSEQEADYYMGRGCEPDLPGKDTEDDFYYTKEVEAETYLASKGVRASGRALTAITDFVVETAEYTSRDFYR